MFLADFIVEKPFLKIFHYYSHWYGRMHGGTIAQLSQVLRCHTLTNVFCKGNIELILLLVTPNLLFWGFHGHNHPWWTKSSTCTSHLRILGQRRSFFHKAEDLSFWRWVAKSVAKNCSLPPQKSKSLSNPRPLVLRCSKLFSELT